ncbi:MAG TPA: FecR family protein [Terriglobales bacterium]|nr:FecR family protein [Terriglobales bacterium]
MKSIFHCILLLLALGLPLRAVQKAESQPITLPSGSAVIAEVKGKVSVIPPQGTPTVAQRGVVLSPETSIETAKGTVILLLSDGSQVLVKSKTRVVLKSPSSNGGSFLQMFIGEILANIKKRLGETPPFRMGTPSAVITVRGTRFSVVVDKKGKTSVDVFEGIVEVEGLGEKARAVLVRPGLRTEVQPGRQPQEPQLINQLGLMGPGYGQQNPAGLGNSGQRPSGQQPSGQQPSGNKPEGPDN